MTSVERATISVREFRVYRLFENSPLEWYSNADVTEATGMSDRTARMHTLRLFRLGMIERRDLTPIRYRLRSDRSSVDRDYANRLADATEVYTRW